MLSALCGQSTTRLPKCRKLAVISSKAEKEKDRFIRLCRNGKWLKITHFEEFLLKPVNSATECSLQQKAITLMIFITIKRKNSEDLKKA